MTQQSPLSALPESWGGPFLWFRNDRGNMELIRLADVTVAIKAASTAIRQYLGEVSA